MSTAADLKAMKEAAAACESARSEISTEDEGTCMGPSTSMGSDGSVRSSHFGRTSSSRSFCVGSPGESAAAAAPPATCTRGFAATALCARLDSTTFTGVPSWARYAPPAVWKAMGWKAPAAAEAHAATAPPVPPASSAAAFAGAAATAKVVFVAGGVAPIGVLVPGGLVGGFAGARSGVAGNVWRLSRCPRGCRHVQQAFEEASSIDERMALAAELRRHVWEAAQCPHANHVLQKCVTSLPPHALQFVVDEIMARRGMASRLAQHKYGCRVIQRLLAHCTTEQVAPLVAALLVDAPLLAGHAFGNYVMQDLLDHGTDEQRRGVIAAIEQNVAHFATDIYAGALVGKAISLGPQDARYALARAMLAEPGLLVRVAVARHAHVAVKGVIDLLRGPERQAAVAVLVAEAAQLSTNRYGKAVLAHLGVSVGVATRLRMQGAEAVR